MRILRSRQGAAGSAMLLMVVAFVGIGGLMYWLNVQAAETQVLVEEEPEEQAGPAGMAFSEFASDPAAHMATDVSVRDVEVVSLMGEHQFWTQLNPNTPFLIRLAPDVVTGGLTFAAGDMLGVTGRVLSMSDSILDDWIAAGTLTEDQRFEAEFAESFFEANAASH